MNGTELFASFYNLRKKLDKFYSCHFSRTKPKTPEIIQSFRAHLCVSIEPRTNKRSNFPLIQDSFRTVLLCTGEKSVSFGPNRNYWQTLIYCMKFHFHFELVFFVSHWNWFFQISALLRVCVRAELTQHIFYFLRKRKSMDCE